MQRTFRLRPLPLSSILIAVIWAAWPQVFFGSVSRTAPQLCRSSRSKAGCTDALPQAPSATALRHPAARCPSSPMPAVPYPLTSSSASSRPHAPLPIGVSSRHSSHTFAPFHETTPLPSYTPLPPSLSSHTVPFV